MAVRFVIHGAGALMVLMLAGAAGAQSLAPAFAAKYTLNDLGSIPGVPPLYGGLTFKQGDPNTILIGGNANDEPGALYAVPLLRDADNTIIGFAGEATYFADAAWNDGGVAYGPDGVLFTSRWPVNQLGQLKPGSTTTDKIIDLAPLGIAQSHASINFPPSGFPGFGRVKLCSWPGGEWYDAELAPDGMGTFDLINITQITESTLPGGPEGFAYVPFGSPGFTHPAMLVSEFSAGSVSIYQLGANGDPIAVTRQDFITGLTGAEGAAIDPLTGDFVFSTFGGGDRLIVVSGFEIPAPSAAGVLGLAGLAMIRRRR